MTAQPSRGKKAVKGLLFGLVVGWIIGILCWTICMIAYGPSPGEMSRVRMVNLIVGLAIPWAIGGGVFGAISGWIGSWLVMAMTFAGMLAGSCLPLAGNPDGYASLILPFCAYMGTFVGLTIGCLIDLIRGRWKA